MSASDARVHRCSCGSWVYGSLVCTVCTLLTTRDLMVYT